MARTVVITAQTVINAAHNTKNLHPTPTGQVKYIAKHYHAPLQTHHTQKSAIPTTLSKSPSPLASPQPSQNCTIPLAFRRASVCVCLYGFVFALSLSLFVGEELAPPVAPNTAITTTVAKSQPPLAQHHVLASPRKRVRFCCSVKPSQLWWGLLPIRTINEIFRTIPLAFRRGGARSSRCT